MSNIVLDCEKVLEVGSPRWIGRNFPSLAPNQTVIAGKSMESISKAINMPCFKFGRLSIKNVFVAHDSNKLCYVYVNPNYRNYRKAFQKIIGEIQTGVHVDHVLSRSLARHFGYPYVLLCIIPGKVNSRHGYFESIKANLVGDSPEVCYSDDRVYDKILARNPTARRKKDVLLSGYTPEAKPENGLALNQQGLWSAALGLDKLNMETLIEKTFKI
ncbi:hypothetical protein GU926_11045 [Nibribacter ruber]|uniref:Uncharacterized protein n=1 Tax=Nibribacter ruber TaxID=2698458 RepID=A0A6P1P0M8_9BACT|nr:hypothetical protein [Nibribacter ruber]QHL87938.1 hypothetical protein GU926_11045 [Nibribacter ruber]